MESASKCQMCGTSAWEWEVDRFAYEPVIQQCHGCYVKDALQEEASMPGQRVTLLPKRIARRMSSKPNRAPGLGGGSRG